jgi:hypothetical protein
MLIAPCPFRKEHEMEYSGAREPIGEREIDEFSQKLAAWAEGLPPAEQGLARVLLARASAARGIQGADFTYQEEGREPWRELISSVFRPGINLEFQPELGAYFAKETGPSWNKGSWIATEDLRSTSLPGDSTDVRSETPLPPADGEPPAIASLGDHLADLASSLEVRERQTLRLLLYRAMDPVERVRWTSDPDLLDAEQEALLRTLAQRHRTP